MTPLMSVPVLLLSVLALWFGAVLLVEGASRVAKRLGVSDLIIGLTVVAFGTSAPEFVVTVGAALKGQPEISVANVVGSNIFNLFFILGTVALIRPVTTSRLLVRRDGVVLIGITLLLIALFADSTLRRWEGALLMGGLVAYLALLYSRREVSEDEIPRGDFRWFDLLRLFGGLAVVIAGGHALVGSSLVLARAFGVSEWLIGVTVVGAGTSTPELATSLVAVIRGRHGLSVGNLIGSDIFNMLGVLGLAGLLHPLTIRPEVLVSMGVMAATVALAIGFMSTGKIVSRPEGVVLILIGLGRWTLDAFL